MVVYVGRLFNKEGGDRSLKKKNLVGVHSKTSVCVAGRGAGGRRRAVKEWGAGGRRRAANRRNNPRPLAKRKSGEGRGAGGPQAGRRRKRMVIFDGTAKESSSQLCDNFR